MHLPEHLESALLVEQGAQSVAQLRALLSEEAARYPRVSCPQHLVVGVCRQRNSLHTT